MVLVSARLLSEFLAPFWITDTSNMLLEARLIHVLKESASRVWFC